MRVLTDREIQETSGAVLGMLAMELTAAVIAGAAPISKCGLVVGTGYGLGLTALATVISPKVAYDHYNKGESFFDIAYAVGEHISLGPQGGGMLCIILFLANKGNFNN